MSVHMQAATGVRIACCGAMARCSGGEMIRQSDTAACSPSPMARNLNWNALKDSGWRPQPPLSSHDAFGCMRCQETFWASVLCNLSASPESASSANQPGPALTKRASRRCLAWPVMKPLARKTDRIPSMTSAPLPHLRRIATLQRRVSVKAPFGAYPLVEVEPMRS